MDGVDDAGCGGWCEWVPVKGCPPLEVHLQRRACGFMLLVGPLGYLVQRCSAKRTHGTGKAIREAEAGCCIHPRSARF